MSRLADSAETAFFEGDGCCMLRFYPANILHTFSTRFEADGITFREPDDNMFSFNSPLGACERCEGFGRVMGISEHLVVPDTSKSWAWSCLLWSCENLKKKVEIDRTFLGFIDIFKGFLTKSFLYGTSAIWYNINWKSWIESSEPKRSEVTMLRLFCFHFQSLFCFAVIRFAFMRLFSLTLTQLSIRLLLLHQS